MLRRRGSAPSLTLRDAAERADSGLVSVFGDGTDLWRSLKYGHQLWREHGWPELWEFGMTVTDHAQTVWAGARPPAHTPAEKLSSTDWRPRCRARMGAGGPGRTAPHHGDRGLSRTLHSGTGHGEPNE